MQRSDRDRRAEKARSAAAELSASGVSAVAVTWVDTSGVTRVKTVPKVLIEVDPV